MVALTTRAWCQVDPWTRCPWTATGTPAEVDRAGARHMREHPGHAVQTSTRPIDSDQPAGPMERTK